MRNELAMFPFVLPCFEVNNRGCSRAAGREVVI